MPVRGTTRVFSFDACGAAKEDLRNLQYNAHEDKFASDAASPGQGIGLIDVIMNGLGGSGASQSDIEMVLLLLPLLIGLALV